MFKIINFKSYKDLMEYYKEIKDTQKTDENSERILFELDEIKKVQDFIRNYRVIGKTPEVKELMFQEYKRNLIAQRRNELAEYDEAIAALYNQEIEDTKNSCKTLERITTDAINL